MYDTEYFKDYKENKGRTSFWYTYIKKNISKDSNILELGCGTGYILKALSKDFNTYGLDISEEAIKIAKTTSPESTLIKDNAETFKIDAKFNVIFCLDVLEHLKEPNKCIQNCYKHLNENGIIIISVPNINSLLKPLKKEKWFGYKDKTHVSLLDPKEWKEIIKKNNFRIIKKFTDGFFDIPYLPLIPKKIQKIFLIPGVIQYKLKIPFINGGENIIIIAQK